jgi:hypothetical protein
VVADESGPATRHATLCLWVRAIKPDRYETAGSAPDAAGRLQEVRDQDGVKVFVKPGVKRSSNL